MGDEQFNSIVENIRKENKLETEEQFQAALKQEGLTMLDLRRQLEKQMLVNRVQQTEVMGKIGVTDEEVDGLLRRAQGRVHDAADRHAARDPGGGADARDGRRERRPPTRRRAAKADDIRKRLHGRRAVRARWPPTCPTRRRRPTAG